MFALFVSNLRSQVGLHPRYPPPANTSVSERPRGTLFFQAFSHYPPPHFFVRLRSKRPTTLPLSSVESAKTICTCDIDTPRNICMYFYIGLYVRVDAILFTTSLSSISPSTCVNFNSTLIAAATTNHAVFQTRVPMTLTTGLVPSMLSNRIKLVFTRIFNETVPATHKKPRFPRNLLLKRPLPSSLWNGVPNKDRLRLA